MYSDRFDFSRFPYVKIANDACEYFFNNPEEVPPKNVKELEERFIKWLKENKIELSKKIFKDIRIIITPDRMKRRKSIILKGN
jgi:hypothetical protein